MGAGAEGELKLLYMLSLYVLLASFFLSIFAVNINLTSGMVNPQIAEQNNNCNGILCISDELSKFITVFSGLLVWAVPAEIIPLEIQIPFILFPKLAIFGIILMLIIRLIP